MNVSLALLADYANSSADGKLNILGIFDTITAPSYPAVHPEMKLVVRFQMHPAESGQTKKVQIQLRTDQGRKLLELGGDMTIETRDDVASAGQMVSADQILSLNGLTLEAPGSYEFVILVNGDVKATVPFLAKLLPSTV